MSHYLYQKTMNKLSQSLEDKWNTPVQYLKKVDLHNEDKKWIQKKRRLFFLFI